MKSRIIGPLLLLIFWSIGMKSQEIDKAMDNPLVGFEKFIGGEWHFSESYQVYEWGVGRLFVRAKSFISQNEEPRLVSEGYWFWHPGQEKIKGYFTAIEMPFSFIEYTTHFEDQKMVNELKTFARDGSEIIYTEIIELRSAVTYEWSLLQDAQALMTGTFTRN